MATPRQMTAHTLDPLKGYSPTHPALDFRAKLSANVTIDPVFQGRVVHLNSAVEYEMGVGNSAVMPLFLLSNSDDPDVRHNGGNPATDKGVWGAGFPRGEMSALVGVGSYELLDTEYDNSQNYPPNTHLTATASNTDATTGGRLTVGTRGTNTICGVVSRGVISNQQQNSALAFWPVYIPPTP